ncbi:tRNA (N6-threonylcarbamoyladenosine(37)-N6)-methyltransferase TrmO [Paenibacillus dendritiformis]|uniref:tRNA (N6-threonylcarbamoyladenosine(37)-N6)-methyltransferase TrmO n=1 Tax=Paenibacillus dendritiformis TaxID=130049 RepID=UPI001B24C18C|nr:tRNA (N6-threonylcarbamoyladenosine(37)-N6)-methyltransferase TrmO [Paenibacillus dendritiformis]GIO73497.1 tRNA (N6-threonylcarbamoyladenosine(37)-N6)-methyltransferase TrmO [Paenibacillus dendritiformis]
MNIEPIGTVRSSVTEGVDDNWGKVVAEIHLLPEYADGLIGLHEFSHILVVYYMDRSTFDPAADLVRRPQGRSDMPDIGIFAQRAKHRPNPIGITCAKLVNIEGAIIRVQGLDAIDDTPVLDVKPHFPAFDSPSNPQVPAWVNQLMSNYF